jgi:hypothetical protein
MAKIGQAITDIGDIISDGIRRFADSGIAGKATSAAYNKVIKPIGRAIGNTGLKVGASGLETTAEGVDFFRRNKNTIKKVGTDLLTGTANEVGTLGKAAFGAVELMERAGILESTAGDLGKSLVGLKFSKEAKLAMLPLAAGIGLVGGAKESIQNRQGRNDGQLYGITPSMTNPYSMSQQMAYSQIGHSFADNAGADGDLVRAISNMR